YRYVLIANEIANDCYGGIVIKLRSSGVDVVAPDRQPLVPRPDHADYAHSYAAYVRTGLQYPIQNAGTIVDVFGKIGLENDVDAAGHSHPAFHGQTDIFSDFAAASIGAQQILSPDLIIAAADAVLHLGCHAVGVLLASEILCVKTNPGPASGSRCKNNRLEQVLRHIADGGRTGERIIRTAPRIGPPGA